MLTEIIPASAWHVAVPGMYQWSQVLPRGRATARPCQGKLELYSWASEDHIFLSFHEKCYFSPSYYWNSFKFPSCWYPWYAKQHKMRRSLEQMNTYTHTHVCPNTSGKRENAAGLGGEKELKGSHWALLKARRQEPNPGLPWGRQWFKTLNHPLLPARSYISRKLELGVESTLHLRDSDMGHGQLNCWATCLYHYELFKVPFCISVYIKHFESCAAYW